MPSRARNAFNQNAADIDRLVELHKTIGGVARGKREGLEVLNKSAIVLVTAIWEAYCEDLASEALAHIVKRAPNADSLSKHMKQQIATELKKDLNQIALWQLSDNGWRNFLNERFDRLTEERNRQLNTPKADQIDTLFCKAIGLPHVSKAWNWKKMTVDRARTKLDKFVTLRGDIAHRGAAAGSCRKNQVVDYFGHVKHLVSKTGGEVNRFVTEITGKPLWKGKKS